MIVSTDQWSRPSLSNNALIAERTHTVLFDIEQQGDSAIDRYSQQFDGFSPQWITLKPFEAYELPQPLRDAIRLAASRIERFATFQLQSFQNRSFNDDYGVYEQIIAPIERIAAYIPGGKAPLISTALMTLIPAHVAGCPIRLAMSPSTNEALLAAASLAGATHFLRVGGAQAIAAAAFGYDGFARCDMVVGPGNAYVAEAKSQLQNRVKIDTVAGPSEVLIVVDDNSYGDWIIEDALAQSEHGDDASAVIVAASQYALNTIQQRLEQIPNGAALMQRGQIQLVLAKNAQDLINFCNRYAPEHLQWCATSIAPQNLSHFGALFVGEQSPVALGDYLSGPNHTLPTMGSARRSAGLSVADFVRLQTRQTVHNATELYHHAAILAQAEGLLHHRDSLLKRKK